MRDWLAREGFALEGNLATGEYARASKLGATRGLEASFTVAERKGTGGAGAAGAERAAGRAWLLEARDGRAYVLMSICWGKEQRLREDDLRLMLGSLRLQK